MDGWRILYRQPHRGEAGECTDLRNAASCLRFISDRRKESGKIYILNGVPPEGRMSRCGMDRRQFLKCLGTTAGTAVAWGTGLMAEGSNLLSGGFGFHLPEAARAWVWPGADLPRPPGAKEGRVFARTCTEPRRCYVNSGIQRAIETYARKHHAGDSLRVYHVEDRKFQRTDIAGALVLRGWGLYRDALDAEKIVNVPGAK